MGRDFPTLVEGVWEAPSLGETEVPLTEGGEREMRLGTQRLHSWGRKRGRRDTGAGDPPSTEDKGEQGPPSVGGGKRGTGTPAQDQPVCPATKEDGYGSTAPNQPAGKSRSAFAAMR